MDSKKKGKSLFVHYITTNMLFSMDTPGRNSVCVPLDELYVDALNSVSEGMQCGIDEFRADALDCGYSVDDGMITYYYREGEQPRRHKPFEELDFTENGMLLEVGNTFYVRTSHGWVKRDNQRIKETFSPSAIKNCPYFAEWTSIAGHGSRHIFYKDGKLNRYPKIMAEEFDTYTPVLDSMVKHVFGNSDEEFRSGMEYLRVLWQTPYQKLPILCLVSKEQGTGKTTFGGEFMSMLFSGGCTSINKQQVLEGRFNSYETHVVAAFEEISSARTVTEKLKAISTAGVVSVEEKGKDIFSFDSYCHIILLTNNEDRFGSFDETDTRYWVRKLGKIKHKMPHAEWHKKAIAEIPGFRWKLENMKEWDNRQWVDKGRTWFRPEAVRTDAWDVVSRNSITSIEIAVEEALDFVRSEGFSFFSLRSLYESAGLSRGHRESNVRKCLEDMGCIKDMRRGVMFSKENLKAKEERARGYEHALPIRETCQKMWSIPGLYDKEEDKNELPF
jgi:hypothetical protein